MRGRAIGILERVDAGRGLAESHLQPRDPPFVRELVLGVLRRRLTLDAIHDAFGRRPAAELDAPVRAAVRAGLYQIVFMDRVPPHAAVSETVGALRLRSHRAYVNAVLRAILDGCRKVPPEKDRGGTRPGKRLERPGRAVLFFSRAVFPDPDEDRLGWLAAVHSHPRFLVARWADHIGEEATVARMEQDNQPAPLVLRPRAGRVDAAGLLSRLAAGGVVAGVLPRPGGRDAVLVTAGGRGIFGSRAWRAGLFSVQDAAQMDAAEVLAPRPGETTWDACAAPGGKATQLAELAEGEATVIATDRDRRRLQRVDEAVDRLGLGATLRTAVHDALSEAPPPGRPARGFDAILLDAPCSNTAVLGRRPEARWRLTPDAFAERAALQARLIDAVSRHLAPGGRLVYSVCSLEPEEGSGHDLEPTTSPFVWTATADRLAARSAAASPASP